MARNSRFEKQKWFMHKCDTCACMSVCVNCSQSE